SEAIAVPLIPKGATISSGGILSGYEGSFKVGALEIFVNVSSFSSPWHPQVQLTWGNGAAPGDTGSDIDTFTTDPVVKVVSPNGGETFVAGQKVTISYSTRNYPRPVKVAIQLNKGATYPNGPYNPVGVEGLATDYNLATGSYTWTIPLDMPAGSDYSLLISPDYPNTETPLGTAHSSSFTITAPASSGGGGGGGGVVVPVVPSEPPMVVDELSVPEVAEMSYFTLGEGFFCLVTFKSPVAVKGNQVEWSIPGAHFFVNEPDIFWGPGNTGMGFRLFNTSEFQGKSINELRNLLSKLTVGLRFFNLHR
ncbi:MAG: hypothetical protein EXS51_04135, partial [Candidatus Taylorbacteria bacterium]|nr:hypothetical protein [Candidatus Taylorbacteria bacterium]